MIDVLAQEKAAGLHELSGYTDLAERVTRVRLDLLRFLTDAAQQGRTVVGYGAPGKGKTLLNHCGIRSDLRCSTPWIATSTSMAGSLRATRVPILPPERIAADKPDYLLILP